MSPLCCANSSFQWDRENTILLAVIFYCVDECHVSLQYSTSFWKIISFRCLGLHCCTWAFAICGRIRATLVVVWGFYDGFSCCRGAQQWAAAAGGLSSCGTGLVAPQHGKSFPDQGGTHVPCNDRSILHQWLRGSPVWPLLICSVSHEEINTMHWAFLLGTTIGLLAYWEPQPKTKTSWSLFSPAASREDPVLTMITYVGLSLLCSASSWRPHTFPPKPIHPEHQHLPPPRSSPSASSWPTSSSLTGIKRTEPKVGELTKTLSYLYFILAVSYMTCRMLVPPQKIEPKPTTVKVPIPKLDYQGIPFFFLFLF